MTAAEFAGDSQNLVVVWVLDRGKMYPSDTPGNGHTKIAVAPKTDSVWCQLAG